MFDPFGDAQTAGYLRNVHGIKERRRIEALERLAVQGNIVPAASFQHSIRGPIRYSHVLRTHKTLLGALYPWAGNDRSITTPDFHITKAGLKDLFSDPRDVRRAMEYALSEASNPSTMRQKPGWVMGLMAYSHPFLDGNGRTIMAVHQELCFRSGFHIDWRKTDKSRYLSTLTAELQKPGKGLLDSYLAPFVVDKRISLKESAIVQLNVRGRNAPRRP